MELFVGCGMRRGERESVGNVTRTNEGDVCGHIVNKSTETRRGWDGMGWEGMGWERTIGERDDVDIRIARD